MQTGIYGIFNQINGRVYIGQAINFEIRKKNHFNMLRGNRHPNNHLQRAFNKYGEINFRFVVICRCDESELVELEQAWLDYYPTEMKYNQAASAENPMLGRRHTAESRAVMSRNRKGKKRVGWRHSPESIEKMRQTKLGKKMSSATRKRMSRAQTGRTVSAETREKLRQSKLGKPRSEETKRKISEARIGFRQSEETKQKISEGLRGQVISPETRKKISRAKLGKKASAETRERMRRPKSEEAKENMRKAAKARWADPEFRARMVAVRRARPVAGVK